MKAFDYPRCELYDLICRQDLLCDESAHNRITDLECIGGLLPSDPEPLLRWHTDRKPLVWRTCCACFSVQVLPLPVR
jgi:hypothetical protein